MEDRKEFVRALFTEGMLLTASDLNTLQTCHGEKHRLVNHAMFGYGVVCGLHVGSCSDFIQVAPGLAVDRSGREIYVAEEYQVACRELFGQGAAASGLWHLCLEYQETLFGEAAMLPNHPLKETVPNRIRESFRLLARKERYPEDICIARVSVVWEGDNPLVTKVESPLDPFHFAPFWKTLAGESRPQPSITCSTGVILFQGGPETGSGHALYSSEIRHGLGSVPGVEVTLSLESGEGEHTALTGGATSLFGNPIRMATKIYPRRGTFVAALRVRPSMSFPIRVRWKAVRYHAMQEQPDHVQKPPSFRPAGPGPAGSPTLWLRPAAVTLKIGQTVRFSPISAKGRDLECEFRVVEKYGGTIDAGGLYTPAGHTGLFHIEARPRGKAGPSAAACVYVSE